MSVVGNQQRMLGEFLVRLRPHWRRDPSLPERIEGLLRHDRRCGSRDRRLYRELIYTALRHLPWIEPLLDGAPGQAVRTIAWLAAETPATANFRAAATEGWPPRESAGVAERSAILARLIGDPARESLLPPWFAQECPEAFASPNYDALNTRAPLWLRLQTADPAAVFDEFAARGWAWRQSELLPAAIELKAEADVTKTDAYRRGLFEIQDLGSQLILESIGIESGGRWLDACAGAGGKSLQLAGLLGPAARVEAHDVRAKALDELGRRAGRAGLAGRISRPGRLEGPYDGVLVDAPCSGTGTWRRSPHLKWVTTLSGVAACARDQRTLLAEFAGLARPGGRLIYATCSLCRSENEAVIRDFLSAHPAFAPAPFAQSLGGEPRGAGLVFWPAAHNGDGFFVASLRRV